MRLLMTGKNPAGWLGMLGVLALVLWPRIPAAQEFEDVKPSVGELTLKQQGSFFIGGNTHEVPDPYAGVGTGARPGNSMINQMYVQFQKPAKSNHLPPIVFVHGCCLSSKTWETTPDGRMGWYEYFTRKGFDTYMADQVGRARSGFDALQYQKVRYDSQAPEFTDDGTGVGCVNGASPPGPNPSGCLAPGDPRGNPVIPPLAGKTGTTNPSILIATDMFAWNVFRYGPPCTEPCGAFTSPPTIAPWADEQFPMQTVLPGGSQTFFKQVIPDLSASLGTFGPNAADIRSTPQRMAVLAKKLGGAILVGHSQSSSFPTKAALQDPTGVRGIIQLETGCFMPGPGGTLTDADVAVLAKIPMLIVEGDHFTTGNPPVPQPRPVSPCPQEIAAITAAGGDITYVHLPEVPGIGTGNSHMFMQDHNNLKIADLIIDWIRQHVGRQGGSEESD
jgi:pimeloyl-ACP methyl ester carboxylesterase